MNKLSKFLVFLVIVLFIMLIYETAFILKLNNERKVSHDLSPLHSIQKPSSKQHKSRLFDLYPEGNFSQWSPFQELEQLQKKFDGFLFDDFGGDVFDKSFDYFDDYLLAYPEIDIKENLKEYIVTANIPGLEEDKVKVEIDNNILTISGSYKTENQTGTFLKSFPLPSEVKVDKVITAYKDKALIIKLPKKTRQKTKLNLKKK